MIYTIYKIATGEILRLVSCNDPEEQISDSENYVQGEYSDLEYEIINGQAVLKPAPEFDAVSAATAIRVQRNKLLLGTDYTQLPDSVVDKSAWAVYRQELRDITKQATFPENVVWPIAPH